MPKRLPMTNWFDPALLIRTAIRAAVSTVFGEFADRREAIASANAIAPSPPECRHGLTPDGFRARVLCRGRYEGEHSTVEPCFSIGGALGSVTKPVAEESAGTEAQ